MCQLTHASHDMYHPRYHQGRQAMTSRHHDTPPVPCRQAAQDRRLMCPMAGAENHPRCRRNEQGQPLLVNGVAWQQYLMLLMMSTKLLTECDKVLKVKPSASCRQWLGCGKQTHLEEKGSG